MTIHQKTHAVSLRDTPPASRAHLQRDEGAVDPGAVAEPNTAEIQGPRIGPEHRLYRYTLWQPEDPRTEGHLPTVIGKDEPPPANAVAVTKAEVVALVTVLLAAEHVRRTGRAHRQPTQLEAAAWEIWQVIYVIASRNDRHIHPSKASYGWLARQIAQGEMGRLRGKWISALEARDRNQARARRARAIVMEKRVEDVRACWRTPYQERSPRALPVERWAKRVVDAARDLGLVTGGYSEGRYLSPLFPAVRVDSTGKLVGVLVAASLVVRAAEALVSSLDEHPASLVARALPKFDSACVIGGSDLRQPWDPKTSLRQETQLRIILQKENPGPDVPGVQGEKVYEGDGTETCEEKSVFCANLENALLPAGIHEAVPRPREPDAPDASAGEATRPHVMVSGKRALLEDGAVPYLVTAKDADLEIERRLIALEDDGAKANEDLCVVQVDGLVVVWVRDWWLDELATVPGIEPASVEVSERLRQLAETAHPHDQQAPQSRDLKRN